MKIRTSLLVISSIGALALSGCGDAQDPEATSAEAVQTGDNGSAPSGGTDLGYDPSVQKHIGELAGAYCSTTADSDDPDDWGCAVKFAVTDLKTGSTCQELGYGGQNSFAEPETTMLRIDTDITFKPEVTEQEAIFGAATQWEVVSEDGVTRPLTSRSACYDAGGYDGNNNWNSPSQPGRKYQRSTLFELPEGAVTLVLSSLQMRMEWEWDLSAVAGNGSNVGTTDGGVLSEHEPQPTTAGA